MSAWCLGSSALWLLFRVYNSSREQEIHSGDISMQVSQEAHALWSSIRHLNKEIHSGHASKQPPQRTYALCSWIRQLNNKLKVPDQHTITWTSISSWNHHIHKKFKVPDQHTITWSAISSSIHHIHKKFEVHSLIHNIHKKFKVRDDCTTTGALISYCLGSFWWNKLNPQFPWLFFPLLPICPFKMCLEAHWHILVLPILHFGSCWFLLQAQDVQDTPPPKVCNPQHQNVSQHHPFF